MGIIARSWWGDRTWWIHLGIRIWSALLLAEILTSVYARPIFGGATLILTPIMILAALTVYGVRRRRTASFNREVARRLPPFEARRKAELLARLQEDPAFQTPCTTCHHFDPERRGCRLVLPNRTLQVRLAPLARHTHCLYWNVSDEPLLLQPDLARR